MIPGGIRDEKVKVLRSVLVPSVDAAVDHVVRGQYRGYRQEPAVASDSKMG